MRAPLIGHPRRALLSQALLHGAAWTALAGAGALLLRACGVEL